MSLSQLLWIAMLWQQHTMTAFDSILLPRAYMTALLAACICASPKGTITTKWFEGSSTQVPHTVSACQNHFLFLVQALQLVLQLSIHQVNNALYINSTRAVYSWTHISATLTLLNVFFTANLLFWVSFPIWLDFINDSILGKVPHISPFLSPFLFLSKALGVPYSWCSTTAV